MVAERPNIVLITTDQQRGDCLGIDAQAPAALQTPNLDFIGRSGAHFTHAYAECPSCIPARRTLMTGMAPAANGVVGFQSTEWYPEHTLAGELTRAGYQTEMIGKLHLHPVGKRYGFEHLQLANATRGRPNEYIDWLRQYHGHHAMDPGMAHGVSSNGWVGRSHYLPEEQMHSFWCVDRAMEFLEHRDPTTPFFLNISFIDPHPPLTPPAFYYERYLGRDLPIPVRGDWADVFGEAEKGLNPDASMIRLDEQDMHCSRAAYYGMINFIDDQIGRLLQFTGQLSDCLVLFTSDHGEMLGDHDHFRKTWPYEASARVPLLIRAPQSWCFSSEVVCEEPVALQDIMPTILEAADVDIPPTCTGHSLLPVLRGEASGVRSILHGEHAGCYAYDQGNHFVTDGHHKYVWFSQTGIEHLFDLDEDPQEEHDLSQAPDAQERLETWRQNLIALLLGRPEGFTDGERLIVGKPHEPVMPGYLPDEVFPFL